jgi:ferric-dicitrate binding protein FerR (iron transport regulator)
MKEKTNKNIDISKLLALHLSGSLSEQENKELNAWLQKKASRKHLLKNLQNEKHLAKRREIIARINLDNEWCRFQSATKEESKTRKLIWKEILKYAAIIVLPLLLGTYLIFHVDTPSEFVADIPIEIQPGVKKAQLVLSNGEKIELSGDDLDLSNQEIGVKIENKNKALNYATVEKQKGKLRYNLLLIGRGEEYHLTLADGTKVWLNSESQLKYPTQFADNIREVELEGEGYFEVVKNTKAPFIVKTMQMNVEVLGTSFNLSAYQNEEKVKATLVEGSVKVVANYGTEKPRIIKPDVQAIFDINTNKIKLKQVDAQVYGRWREGVFAFNEDNLEEIMRRLARWYNIRVFYQDNDVRNYQFSGKLPRFKTCNELLEMIEKTTNVKFQIKDEENVIISRKR